MKKSFLYKPAVRITVHSFFTIAIGIMSSILANNLNSLVCWLIFIVLAIAYVFILVLYTKIDGDNSKSYDELVAKYDRLEEQSKQFFSRTIDYEIAMQNIVDLCRESSTETNKQIHAIYNCPDPKNVKLTWNFNSASSMICRSAYDGIIKNSNVRLNGGTVPSVELSYVKLIESNPSKEDDERIISLCGYYHPVKNGTKSLLDKKKIKEIMGNKHYAMLFSQNITDPEILLNSVDVQRVFGNSVQYSQYIAIPVRCESINQNSKLVGIFQIACLDGYIITDNQKEMNYLVTHFLTPFSYFFLLLYKMEKAMLAAPKKESEKNESESKNDEKNKSC